MSVQQSDHSLTQKQSITFAAITVCGIAALLLGLALIIFAHYHERAYVFLGLGAAGFIGGLAGIVGAGSKVKAALSYGVIALGMMGIIVGLNYLTNSYGPHPNQARGDIVIALSIVAILFERDHAGGDRVTRHRGADRRHDLPGRAGIPGTRLSPAWHGGSVPSGRHRLWYLRSEQSQGHFALISIVVTPSFSWHVPFLACLILADVFSFSCPLPIHHSVDRSRASMQQ